MIRTGYSGSNCFLPVFAVVGLFFCSTAVAYDPPRNLTPGWNGSLQVGGLATFGEFDTSALLARTDFTYRGSSWEHEFNTKFYRSKTQILVPRRDADGVEVTDANGNVISDLLRATNNNRRYVSAQPRWFFSSRFYVFAIVDFESNKPLNISHSSRQITGVGYKLWKSRKDFVSAALGVGRKKLERVTGANEEGAIGYFGFRFNRAVSEGVSLVLDLDSEFGGENRFSEMGVGIAWKLRDPLSIKLKYEARFNSQIPNLSSTFDNDLEAALSAHVELEVF